MIAKNYIGVRFGTRVCVDQVKAHKRGTKLILKCDCGRVGTATPLDASKRGCVACSVIKHGYSPGGKRTPTYQSWRAMIARCRNEKRACFKRYGGAGISVCEKWQRFEGFLEDMGERPAQTSLDRIDNAKGYFKENCRWATRSQQQRNKRNNHLVTINGETKCIVEWGELSGIHFATLFYRVRSGWSEDRLLSPPEKKFAKPKKVG